MSHFSKIRTSLKDLEVLKKSLQDLGLRFYDRSVITDSHSLESHNISLIVPQSNNYDIGFSWNGVEYQLITDIQFWQQPWPIDLFLKNLTQRYAYNSILQITEQKGFQSIEQTKQSNGSIKLVLQRWK
jgi:hypothetical protein